MAFLRSHSSRAGVSRLFAAFAGDALAFGLDHIGGDLPDTKGFMSRYAQIVNPAQDAALVDADDGCGFGGGVK
ncbi:MAG: hypothetical protein VW907_05880 [Opitutae bacterium]